MTYKWVSANNVAPESASKALPKKLIERTFKWILGAKTGPREAILVALGRALA